MKFEPELMRMPDGTPVTQAAQWPARRRELLKTMEENIYGVTPAAPASVTGTVTKEETKVCAGHAKLQYIHLSFDAPLGTAEFPFHLFVPTDGKKHPVFVLLNFRPDVYDMYYPAEEIIDNGYALAVIDYQAVASDDNDFTNGIAAKFPRTGAKNEWGKIGMWAYAASRVIDYLETREECDASHVAVIGHSRLGKTALWCGAQDERVLLSCSNDSGCAGAAYEHCKHEGAETVKRIYTTFPFWFCPQYAEYIDDEPMPQPHYTYQPDQMMVNPRHGEKLPFDQHFLIAACAPRFVAVGSASRDDWADQHSEKLSCIGASPAWQLFGRPGYIGPEAPCEIGDNFDEGDVAYHLRHGVHFLSRADWLAYMAFFKRLCQ